VAFKKQAHKPLCAGAPTKGDQTTSLVRLATDTTC
jgi:hypothetical protein